MERCTWWKSVDAFTIEERLQSLRYWMCIGKIHRKEQKYLDTALRKRVIALVSCIDVHTLSNTIA